MPGIIGSPGDFPDATGQYISTVPRVDYRGTVGTPATFRQIANRCDIPNVAGGAFASGFTTRTKHTYYGQLTTRVLKVGFANFFMNGITEVRNTDVSTVRCAIEINQPGSGGTPSGYYADFTFGGSTTLSFTTSDWFTISDAVDIGFELRHGDTFWVRTTLTAPTASVLQQSVRASGSGVRDEWAIVGNFVHGGEGTGVRAGGAYYGPCALLATTAYDAWANIGDSMIWGQQETQAGDGFTGNRGWCSKWISKMGYGHIRMSKTGDKAQNIAARTQSYLLMAAAGITHLHVGCGDNDMAAGRTRAQTIADLKTLAARAKNASFGNVQKCTISTLTPHVTQTVTNSDWTQANQADPGGPWPGAAEWAAANDQIRAFTTANSGYDMVLEVADLVTPARNSNFWQDNIYGVAGASTPDGVHATNGTIHQAICDALPLTTP